MRGLRPLEASDPAGLSTPGRLEGSRSAVAVVVALAIVAAATTALEGPSASAGWLLGSGLLGAAVATRGPVPALAALLAVSALQNVVAAPLAGSLSASAVVALLLGKELFAAGAGLAGLVRRRAGRWLPGDVAGVAFLAILAAEVGRDLAAGAGIGQGWLAGLRQAATLPFLWFVGRGLTLRDRAEEGAALEWILRVGAVVAVFGIVERFIVGDQLWVSLGLHDLYEKKGLGTFYWGDPLPANFWSYYGGVAIRRLAGTLGEPTSTAHLLAIPTAIFVGAGLDRERPGLAAPFLLLGIGAALLFTLGKSGIAVAAVAAGVALWKTHPRARETIVLLGLLAASLVLVVVRWTPDLAQNVGVHLGALRELVRPSLLGDGFGTAGNVALAIDGGGHSPHLVAESFVAVLDAEAGLVAVVGFFVFVIAAAATLLSAPGSADRVRAVLGGLVLATGLAAIGSETPAGFIGGGTAFLIAGAFAHPPLPASPGAST